MNSSILSQFDPRQLDEDKNPLLLTNLGLLYGKEVTQF